MSITSNIGGKVNFYLYELRLSMSILHILGADSICENN